MIIYKSSYIIKTNNISINISNCLFHHKKVINDWFNL